MSTDIKEVKSIIRGLLTSCAEDMTVGKLRHDYRNQEGHDIPFYDFKFRDVTSFLRSIPDVCEVFDNPYGPYAIVRLVESEKSAHISSLVKRQRPSTKARRRPPSFGRILYRIPHRRAPPKPDVYSTPKSEFSTRKPVISGVSSRLNVLAPEFNARVSNSSKVREVLSPEVPNCDSISRQGNLVEDAAIPSSSHIEELPTEISETDLKIYLKNVIANHEALFIGLDELEESVNLSLSLLGCNVPVDRERIENTLRTMPEFVLSGGKVCCISMLNQDFESPDIDSKFENGENNCTEMEEDVNQSVQNNLVEELAFPSCSSESNDRVQRLERNLYSMMKDCSDGILISELIQNYKMRFAAPLNLQILGCKSTEELVNKLRTIFSCEHLENGDIKLYPAWLPKSRRNGCKKINLNSSTITSFVTPLIKRNVQWLMQNYPNGIPSKDFKDKYKDTFYGEVDLTEMGFSSFMDFFSCLEREGVLQICISDSDTWLVPTSTPIEIPVVEDPLPAIPLETEEDLEQLKTRFPNDVIGLDDHIEQVIIPSWVVQGCMIEIYVQEVHNPHNFWVNFVGELYHAALDTLMDDMQAFYCSYNHSYRMPTELLRKGQDCVCLYNEEWNRARVIRLVNSKEVEVFFYDYGTDSIIKTEFVCFLHSSFSKIPGQAVRAVLANISPKGDKWSKGSAQRFLSLILNRPLIGIVHNVDRQSSVLSLFLCDTNGTEDLYISDVLKAEGYAVECSFNPGDYVNLQDNEEEDLGNTCLEEVACETSLIGDTGFAPNENETSFPITEKAFSLAISKMKCPSLTEGEDDRDVRIPLSNNSGHEVLNAFDEVSDVKSDLTKPNVEINFDAGSSETKSHVPKLAPPPGFSHVANSAGGFNDDFMRSQDVGRSVTGNEGLQHLPNSDKVDRSSKTPNSSTKYANSGVNANVSEEFKTYPGNTQPNYPHWNIYQNPVGFQPPYVPVNLHAPFPLLPLGLPPSPIDIYNAWYYEQMRQAWIRGALAHQQIPAAILPALPNGLFLTPNQNHRTSEKKIMNNQMHISELHSPPLKDQNKPQAVFSASSAATQTERTLSGDSSLVKLVNATQSLSVGSETSEAPSDKREQINGLVSHKSVTVQSVCSENSTAESVNSSSSPSPLLDEARSSSAVSESIPAQKSNSRTEMLQPSKKAIFGRRNSVSSESTSANNSLLENVETVNRQKFDTITLAPFNRRKSEDFDTVANLNKKSTSGLNPCNVTLNNVASEGNICSTGSHKDKDEGSNVVGIESREKRSLAHDPSLPDVEAKGSTLRTGNIPNKLVNSVFKSERVRYVDVILTPISSSVSESNARNSQEQKTENKESRTDPLPTLVHHNSEKSKDLSHIPVINGISSSISKEHTSGTAELLDSSLSAHSSTNSSDCLPNRTKIDNSNLVTLKIDNKIYGSMPDPNSKTTVTLEDDDGNVNIKLTKDNTDTKSTVLNDKLLDSSLMKGANNMYSHNRLPVSSSPLHITKINSISEVVNLPKKETSETWTTTWSTENIAQSVAPKIDAKHSVSGSNFTKKSSIRYYDYIPLASDSKPQYVKKTKLLGHEIHLINLDGRPYVPTDEIVRNFTSFNGHHVVLKILDARKIEINFLELCRRRRPDIFDHLDKTDLRYVSRGPTGNIIGSLHIVPLRSIPYMLKALNKESPTISVAVQEQISNFDPNDVFWQGH